MKYEDVAPHLNKMVRINLKGKRKKVGWLFTDIFAHSPERPLKEVNCLNVKLGRKMIQLDQRVEVHMTKSSSKVILIEDILSIRSLK